MADFWDDAKAALGAVAPILGTAVGGPLGGTAARLVASALGLDPGTAEQQIADAVTSATPDQLLALRKADNDFQVALKQMDLSSDQIAAGDRDSARKREEAVKDNTPRNLAYAYSAMFFTTLICRIGLAAAQIEISQAAEGAIDGLIGILTGMVLGSKEYYFGTSSGSERKTDLLAKAGPIS